MRVYLPLIGVFAFACAVSLQASGNPARLSAATHPSQPLKVQNVKLEPMPHTSGVPNATLSFEILNAGEDDVSQIVVEVEVTKKKRSVQATP